MLMFTGRFLATLKRHRRHARERRERRKALTPGSVVDILARIDPGPDHVVEVLYLPSIARVGAGARDLVSGELVTRVHVVSVSPAYLAHEDYPARARAIEGAILDEIGAAADFRMRRLQVPSSS